MTRSMPMGLPVNSWTSEIHDRCQTPHPMPPPAATNSAAAASEMPPMSPPDSGNRFLCMLTPRYLSLQCSLEFGNLLAIIFAGREHFAAKDRATPIDQACTSHLQCAQDIEMMWMSVTCWRRIGIRPGACHPACRQWEHAADG